MSVLFQALADQVSENEKAQIVRAVGAVAMHRILGDNESNFASLYEAQGGRQDTTRSILSALQAPFDSIEFDAVRPQINPARYFEESVQERTLIERALGTAFFEATAGNRRPLAEVYRSIGGQKDNTIERFEAIQPLFDEVNFNEAALI